MPDRDSPRQPGAVVLLSGGLDSMVTAALAQEAGFAVHALSVDYGQRHRLELESAARIAATPDPALLEQAEEKAVASSLIEVERALAVALKSEDFAGAMNAFAGLRAPIDAFFDKVTVNVTDKPELRLNRLKLLNHIRATMDSVADFSKIEG